MPIADNLIRFGVTGPGKIIGVGNGDPSSHEADRYAGGNYQRHLFNGKCQVIVQATRQSGAIELKAMSGGLQGATLEIRAQKPEPRPSVD